MSGLEISGSQKPFVAKEGTTYDEVQKFGTKMQKKAFIFFDWNHNDKLDGRECTAFNNAKYRQVGDDLIITGLGGRKEYTPNGVPYVVSDMLTIRNVTKQTEVYNLLKQYNLRGIEVGDDDSIKIINDNGKKKLVVDSREYTLTIPIGQQNTEEPKLINVDGEPYFLNLSQGTVVDIKNVPTAYRPTFINSDCQVNCSGRDEGTDIVSVYSTLSIESKNPKNTINSEELPVGKMVFENKTQSDWENAKELEKEYFGE